MHSSISTKLIARAAITMAMTLDRAEERELKQKLLDEHQISAAAVDFGGEFISPVGKIIERRLSPPSARGLSRMSTIWRGRLPERPAKPSPRSPTKAIGLNVGGKIGIARTEDNIAVCVFFGIGLLHLDEIAIGLGHRAI